jgi:hypothetical protein
MIGTKYLTFFSSQSFAINRRNLRDNLIFLHKIDNLETAVTSGSAESDAAS